MPEWASADQVFCEGMIDPGAKVRSAVGGELPFQEVAEGDTFVMQTVMKRKAVADADNGSSSEHLFQPGDPLLDVRERHIKSDRRQDQRDRCRLAIYISHHGLLRGLTDGTHPAFHRRIGRGSLREIVHQSNPVPLWPEPSQSRRGP